MESMRLLAAALAAALSGGPAPAASQPPVGGESGPSPRVRCLLVAPLENASDLPEAAQAANDVLFASPGAARGRALPEAELRAVFAGSTLELPRGVPPSVALDLAEVLGADGVLYGAIEGSARDSPPSLTVTLRLALAGTRELVRTESLAAAPRHGEPPLAALRRAAAEAGREALGSVGGPPLPGCFDPGRLARVRDLAIAAGPAAPTATAAQPAAAPGARPPPPPPSARQVEWTGRLAAGERFVVEGVAFAGRSARLSRDQGLEDLSAALRSAPAARVRIEGFVDSTGRTAEDARLSLAMAQAAVERLVALGVPRDRFAAAGRGGDAPLLPNFTARGRARNRRVEVVALPETAARR